MFGTEHTGDDLIGALHVAHSFLDKVTATGREYIRPKAVILGRREIVVLRARNRELHAAYGVGISSDNAAEWTFRNLPVIPADCHSVVGFAFFMETD